MPDYTTLPVLPWRLLRGAGGERPQIIGRVLTGGSAISGLVQVGEVSGGGRWSYDLTGIVLRTPDDLRCARAWATYLDGGAALAVVPFFDLGQAPRPLVGGVPEVPGHPAPSEDYFAQDPGFGRALMAATITSAAALRATTVDITIARGGRLRGGEHFSVNHPDKGWRTYRVGRVTAVAGVEGGFACEIRPPLRDAVAAGVSVEFDVPRTVMRLDPSKASDFEADVVSNRFATVSASFLEAF